MAVSVNYFNPEVVYSCNKLEQFINDKREINKMIEDCRNESPGLKKQKKTIVWFPENQYLRIVFSIYWRYMGKLIKFTGYALMTCVHTDLGKKCVILGKHILWDASQIEDTSRIFPVTTRNVHNLATDSIFLAPSIRKEETDPIVQELAKYHEEIDFFNDSGICYGSALWFQYLYQNTKHLFSDPIHHIETVGRQFEEGAPVKAALLQSLNNALETVKASMEKRPRIETDLLHLNVHRYFDLIPLSNLEENQIWAKDTFEKMPRGSYLVQAGYHVVNLLKLDRDLVCIFDTNDGIRFDSPSEVLKHLKPYYKQTKHPVVIDRFY